MSVDKYRSIFSRKMETIVYIDAMNEKVGQVRHGTTAQFNLWLKHSERCGGDLRQKKHSHLRDRSLFTMEGGWWDLGCTI